ncbi:MAG TPA: nickel pincer cofactor biosynthesis protein LarB [Patescibacteria group bacterium]|nr:nickel pincer cofactor biosynthesis protein LarB [Patescibacteria group bacterium]
MASTRGFCDLGFAKLDVDRQKRRGFSEAIYCPGKSREHLKKISLRLLAAKQDLLLTKLDQPTYAYLKRSIRSLRYNPLAKIGFCVRTRTHAQKADVIVISAGTADVPVAEEAAVTLEVMGSPVVRLYDVGVAGVHRLMSNLDTIRKAKVVIVVAGMEGALASLVSGLVSAPVIAVPTSCGYGASFGGLSALLTMLNSCSPGVATVNIDNGFGAGYFAHLINQ